MCSFFSCVSKGDGVPMYFDWELRKKCLSGELNYNPDSHTSIADYFGHKGKKEDKLNKYEYNPITQEFVIDQLNTKDDSKEIEAECRALDFSTIIPALICKKPLHPFTIHNEVTQEDIDNLKKWDSVWDSVEDSVRASVWDSVWASVRDSVRDSVWASVRASVMASVMASVRDSVRASVRDSVRDSVRASVRASVRDSVWDSVWDSVGASVWSSVRASVMASVRDSVWDSVRASVWDSVWASVRASVRASVCDSVGAYFSTFFNIEYNIDMSSCIALWNRGFVASYNGKTWRLHSGMDAKIVYEWRK